VLLWQFKKGGYLLNTVSGERERIGRILRMHSNEEKK
jgi:translation elongation factor EF-G